jgi:(2R)-ethylmalonyl-CoA mutase
VEALGYMKERLVEAHAERIRLVESGERVVVGVNRFTETESSPLVEGLGEGFAYHEVDPEAEAEQVEGLARWRRDRDEKAVRRALDALRREAQGDGELVEASIEAAGAGVTTGEWAGALRDVFGDYRAPTGVSARTAGGSEKDLEAARRKVADAATRVGVRRVRMLVGKPGLDGHSNAAEQIAVRARDAGFEVIYQGIRLTPEQIARAAAEEDVHVIGLSVLSGAHSILVPEVLDRLREQGVDPARVPVVVGGIIPDEDAAKLKGLGAAAVYTPLDHDLTAIVGEIADLISARQAS